MLQLWPISDVDEPVRPEPGAPAEDLFLRWPMRSPLDADPTVAARTCHAANPPIGPDTPLPGLLIDAISGPRAA